MDSVRFLHTNDLHGRLSDEKLPALIEARAKVDLYFDSGDLIATGNLGVPSGVDPAWERLSRAGCDAGTIGNRETHLSESAFKMKISGCGHSLLCCNLNTSDGSPVLPGSEVIEVGGLRIGVVGVSVPMVTERMASRHASAYIWTDPISAVAEEFSRLPSDIDLRVLISHVGEQADRELARSGLGIDIIFGGHTHRVWEEPEREGDVWLCQGGSHARYFGVYEWDIQARRLGGGLIEWP